MWTPDPSTFITVEQKMLAAIEAAQNQFSGAIQSYVDAVAKVRRYDNGLSLATYVASERPAWKAEAEAFVKWRDDVWDHAYREHERVLSGERAQPSIEELLAELPAPPWPLL